MASKFCNLCGKRIYNTKNRDNDLCAGCNRQCRSITHTEKLIEKHRGKMCRVCGSMNCILNEHHLTYEHLNGYAVTHYLCRSCHVLVHYIIKGHYMTWITDNKKRETLTSYMRRYYQIKVLWREKPSQS